MPKMSATYKDRTLIHRFNKVLASQFMENSTAQLKVHYFPHLNADNFQNTFFYLHFLFSCSSADDQYDREVHHELIAVLHNGTVKWIPSAIYKSSCQVDMTNFPFDEQTCLFKFGSWTYDGNKVNLDFLGNSSAIDMQEYVMSSEWKILDTQGKKECQKVYVLWRWSLPRTHILCDDQEENSILHCGVDIAVYFTVMPDPCDVLVPPTETRQDWPGWVVFPVITCL